MQLALDCGAILTAFRSAKDFEKVASEMVAEVSVSKYLQLHDLILSRLCSSMRAAQQQIGETSVQRNISMCNIGVHMHEYCIFLKFSIGL